MIDRSGPEKQGCCGHIFNQRVAYFYGGEIQMKYIDRKGNITIEENEQDKFLRHLYNDRGGRLCLKLLIRPFVSKAAGVLLNTRFSARFVPDFVKNNKIDLSIYEILFME